MNNVLEGLEPSSVFSYFEEISNIPRGSGNEKEISDYLVKFAQDRKLEVIQDDALNVIIKKTATKGYENAPTVILQGHMDIVCEKNFDTEHNFLQDPIKLLVDGDFISADGTTLGGDNGIAVAYCLALLNSQEIEHPAIEALFTTDEEVGMNGAIALDASNLEGRYLINLDSEEEGEFLVSCAGGLKVAIDLPIDFVESEGSLIKIMVKGLKGGHSGGEIDKNRANSNKLLGRILHELNKQVDTHVVEMWGGSKDNAIPREAYANVIVNKDDISKLEDIVNNMEKIVQKEYKTSDSGIVFVVTKEDETIKKNTFSKNSLNELIYLLMNVPNGIQSMSADIEGLVESSLNLGVITTSETSVELILSVRSSIGSLKQLIREQLELFANKCGAKFVVNGQYPEWEYRKESKLRDIFIKTYENMYSKKPLIKAIHAGLECGVFDEKIESLDMISIGPNMFDVHTPDEKLSISSTKRTWEFLLNVLKNIK